MQAKPLDVEVGKIYRIASFKAVNQWIFFKVTFKNDLAAPAVLNLFMNTTWAVNTTRVQPPYRLLVSERQCLR
jgi:hypothetical protein